MSDELAVMNVRPIRADVVFSEGKQTFLDTMAEAFDEVVREHKEEPIAFVYSLVLRKGGVRTGYHTLGDCADSSSLYVARAVLALNADAMQWDYSK